MDQKILTKHSVGVDQLGFSLRVDMSKFKNLLWSI